MSAKKNKLGAEGGRKPRFPELPPKYSASRELRNKAEKMRRDRLNKLIEEIRSLVPIICNKTKKSETTRSNILRLTANFLRLQQIFPSESSPDGPKDSTSTALEPVRKTPDHYLLGEGTPHLESMEGFFFLLAADGRVLFVSENVDKFIGYCQIDVMGHPIYNFTHPADLAKIQNVLTGGKRSSSASPSPASSPGPSMAMSLLGLEEEEERRQSFFVRLREKPLAKNDSAQYEHLHVVGRRRKVDVKDKRGLLGAYTFVGVMRPVRDRPITELSLVESVQDQYITRHLPDGRIIYADHRISSIAGYLPCEVQGKSAFNFFNAEDLPWTTMAMRHMFASSNGEGSTVYRLVTQTGQFICLQTKGYLEFNKTTNKIETFICINTVIRPEEEEKYLMEQKERFSPFITEVQINAMRNSKPYGITFTPPAATVTAASLAQTVPSVSPSQCSPPAASAQVSVISAPRSPSQSLSAPRSPSQSQLTAPRSPSQSLTAPRSPSLKRSLSPQRVESFKRPALSPTADMPSLMEMPRKRRMSGDHGARSRKSLQQPLQYISRTGPVHRVEDGQRVVDIDQDFIFPPFNGSSQPSGGDLRSSCHTQPDLADLIHGHNEGIRQRLAVPSSLLTLDSMDLDLNLNMEQAPQHRPPHQQMQQQHQQHQQMQQQQMQQQQMQQQHQQMQHPQMRQEHQHQQNQQMQHPQMQQHHQHLPQRVNSVIQIAPSQQTHGQWRGGEQRSSRGDLIAEKLKLLAPEISLLPPEAELAAYTTGEAQDLYSLMDQEDVLMSFDSNGQIKEAKQEELTSSPS